MRILLSIAFLATFHYSFLSCQSSILIVNRVNLINNSITKDDIIVRELDFAKGDTLRQSEINNRFFENEKRLLSTGLFTHVKINLKNWDPQNKTAIIEITVKENWYLYPYPIFELADRNFNVWWTEQNRSFSRVNYGMRITHINFSGRRDKLKVVGQFGYTRKYELEYSRPYIDVQQRFGFTSNIFYSENKEIGYLTSQNKTQFHKETDERIMLWRFRLSSSLSFRPELFHFHSLKLEFHRNRIDQIIAEELNPDYFLNQKSLFRFFKLEYDYHYDKRIFRLYPESGFLLGWNIKKEGLGIWEDYNNVILSLRAERYIKLNDSIFIGGKLKLKVNLNKDKLAFANNTALGYGEDIVRGYELYVLDGSDFVLLNTSFRIKLFEKLVKLNKAMPIDQFDLLNIKMYISMHFDAGYVNERDYIETNNLNNQWVNGYGAGVNVVLFNNYLIQFEYSINQLGEKGLYIHQKTSF